MDAAARGAEWTDIDARCAASPREAANYAALLRRTPRAEKLVLIFDRTIDNLPALVRLLLADGLSPNTIHPVHGNSSLLHVAAEDGSIDVVRLLLEAGADSNYCDALGHTPLVNAIVGEGTTGVHGNRLACARELIPHTDLRIFSAGGKNALHHSINGNGNLEVFKLLLPHFADYVDVRTIEARAPAVTGKPYNATPLYLACQGGHHVMVKALLAAGASRTACTSKSASSLHAAANFGHLACVTLLIGRPDSQKMSPAELDAQDVMGRTALLCAAWCGHRYCCAALLAAGADAAVADCDGHTALDAAKHFQPGNQELIELLECRGGGPAPLLCAGCGASDKRLHLCSACGSAAFCSDACMAQAWTKGKHKAECKRIRAAKKEEARSRIIIHDAVNLAAPL